MRLKQMRCVYDACASAAPPLRFSQWRAGYALKIGL